jgi:hypothetical protein
MMPTYKNNTRNNIDLTFEAPHGRKRIVPGEQVEIEEIYTDVELVDLGLTKIANTPFYNPLKYVHPEVATAPDEIKEVDIDPLTRVVRVESTVNIEIYINDLYNLPAYPLVSDRPMDFANRRNILKIFLKFEEAGECTVLELEG